MELRSRIQKTRRFCLPLLILIFLFSGGTLVGQNTLRVKGKTVNGKTDYLVLSKINFWYFLPDPTDTIRVTENKFDKTVTVSNEPLFVYCGKKNLGLIFPDLKKKTDTLELLVDIDKSEFIIDNKDKLKYDYFYAYQGRYRVNGGYDSAYLVHLTLESNEFIRVIREQYLLREKEISAQASALNLQTSLSRHLLKTNYYEYYCKLYDYSRSHLWFVRKEAVYSPPDAKHLALLNGLVIDTNDIRIPEFGYLIKYILDNANDSAASNPASSVKTGHLFKFNYAGQRFSGRSKDLARTQVIKDMVDKCATSQHFSLADSLIGVMEKTTTDKTYLTYCKRYLMQKNPFSKGMDFTLPTREGKEFRSTDVSDKTVVLFFWGTWCGPCKKQLPALNQLISDLKDDHRFVFVNIALEKNNWKNWTEKTSDYKLGGINLYAEGLAQNGQISRFNVTSVPRVVILVKNQIFSFNATMPLDGLKKELLGIPD